MSARPFDLAISMRWRGTAASMAATPSFSRFPDLKLILGYSSQVGRSGFAIFAELQGSERRSLSLRRPHNLATGVSLARVSVVT
jgi:hypothetical protein